LMFNSHKHSAQKRTVGITETPQDARSELPCYQITVPQRGKTAAAAMRYNGSSPVASACSTCMQYILPHKPGWYMRTYQQKPHSVISKPIRHAYAVAMQERYCSSTTYDSAPVPPVVLGDCGVVDHFLLGRPLAVARHQGKYILQARGHKQRISLSAQSMLMRKGYTGLWL
jgi:hypothetical protein